MLDYTEKSISMVWSNLGNYALIRYGRILTDPSITTVRLIQRSIRIIDCVYYSWNSHSRWLYCSFLYYERQFNVSYIKRMHLTSGQRICHKLNLIVWQIFFYYFHDLARNHVQCLQSKHVSICYRISYVKMINSFPNYLQYPDTDISLLIYQW